MNKLSMILSAVTVGAMIVFIAPSIFALNRGHILRNIALWLAIFCALALIYQNFGPDSPHPLFSTPMSRAGEHPLPAVLQQSAPANEPPHTVKAPDNKSDHHEDGFTPPSEE